MTRTARLLAFKSRATWLFAGLAMCAIAATTVAVPARAESGGAPASVKVESDGTVDVPAMSVPVSEYLTPEGKAYLAQHLKDMESKSSKMLPKHGVPAFLTGYLDRAETLFPVEMKDTTIAGVHAYVYTPKAGIAPENRQRVLINLHGGGFGGCWPGCAELEALPISALGRFKVISLDYREGPKYHFPAASEDVAAVYRELLKTYPAKNIGIYGCSAGGMLVGMSEAWFQKEGLPNPGGLGIFCAGMTVADVAFGGDANYLVSAIGEAHVLAEPPPPKGNGLPPLTYMAGTDPNDPLVAPARSMSIMAKFPPTLIITGTRGFELSSAVYTHSQLVKAGADAELHVWEGMFHGFFYNPDVPESRDCFNVIIKFFDRHLGK